MADPKILVLRAAGVNCNEETSYAFRSAGAETREIHINRLLEKPAILREFQGVAVPGGFSYGDDIAAGRVLAVEIGHVLGSELRELVARGGIILGICNGFQVLIKSGLLPGRSDNGNPIRATLFNNESNRYEDRWVQLVPDSRRCVFFRDNEPIELPSAHGEGRFVTASEVDFQTLEAEGRFVVRYVDQDLKPTTSFPANPSGSPGGVAGICDETGQIFGLMPHPERFLFPWQHPEWTRSPRTQTGDGARVFANAVAFLRS